MSAYTQILMQYETPLPDDCTMDQVRKRAVSVAPNSCNSFLLSPPYPAR
jgi:hypothetical protein